MDKGSSGLLFSMAFYVLKNISGLLYMATRTFWENQGRSLKLPELTVGVSSHFHLLLLAKAGYKASPDSGVGGLRNRPTLEWKEWRAGIHCKVNTRMQGIVAVNQSSTQFLSTYEVLCLHCMHAQSLSHVRFFVTPWTIPTRLLSPWDSPGKNTGVGSHFLLQKEIFFPDPGIKPMSPASPALAGGFFGFFTTESPEKPIYVYIYIYKYTWPFPLWFITGYWI